MPKISLRLAYVSFNKKKKKPLEKSIENMAIRMIRATTWGRKVKVRKMSGFGFRSWPDRMFLFPGAIVVFIEFKRPGEDPTPGQRYELQQLEQLGFAVEVCDSAQSAVEVCQREVTGK